MSILTIANCRAIARAAANVTLEEGFQILQRTNRTHLFKSIYLDEAEAFNMQFIDLGDTRSNCYRLMHYLDPIWFLGGPPGGIEWYNGTPLNFFVDCLFNDVLDHGLEWVTETLPECVVC